MKRCGNSDAEIGISGQHMCQWPRGHIITVSIHSELPGLGYEQQFKLTDLAFAAWREVCGMEYRMLDKNKRANIEIAAKRLDGSSGILAQATLPCGPAKSDDQHWQQYDTGETWVVNAAEKEGIDYPSVCIHETGHSLGWGHAPNQDCIMYAAYTGRKTDLCDWEVNQAQERYGIEPGDEPPPPAPPDSPCGDVLDCFGEFLRWYRAGQLRRIRRSRRCKCD